LILVLPKAWQSLQRADHEDRLRMAAADNGGDPADRTDHPENGYSAEGVPARPDDLETAGRGKTTERSE
jgi:hypothetical protein